MQISFITNKTFFNINNRIKTNQKNYSPVQTNSLNRDVFQLSFGAKKNADLSLKAILERSYNADIPHSVRVLMEDKVRNGIEQPLYQVQLEAYKDLLKCKTLEEAKKKYPIEFGDVKSAVQVLEEKEKSNYKPPANAPKRLLYMIKDGEVSGKLKNNKHCKLNIETLSLDLIKLIYGQNYTLSDLSEIFGKKNTKGWSNLCKDLKIPTLSAAFITARTFTDPEQRKIIREKKQDKWDQVPDDIQKERSENLSNAYNSKSDAEKERITQEWRKSMDLRSQEDCEELSNLRSHRMKGAYDILGDDYKIILRSVFALYPDPQKRAMVGKIFGKEKKNLTLSEIELTILNTYYAYRNSYSEINEFLGRAMKISCALDVTTDSKERAKLQQESEQLKADVHQYLLELQKRLKSKKGVSS